MTNILYKPALFFATVLGRLPIWVILLAAISGKLDWRAFACLYSVLLICRAYMASYANGVAEPAGLIAAPKVIISTLWEHCFSWIFRYFLLCIIAFGVFYAFISPDLNDFMLLLLALGFYIPVVIISIVQKKRPEKHISGYLSRTFVVELAIVLLWCYVAFTSDFAAFKLMALVIIYLLEFLSIYRPQGNLNAENA